MKKHLPILILAGCAAIFAFGVIDLFELRFEHGDVYPPYSSLRADPLGTMAFYESLGKIPGVSARRDFSDSNRLPEEPQTVYLHLAGPAYEFNLISPDLFHQLQDYLARGNRLVITFFPRTESEDFYFDQDETNSTGPTTAKNGKRTPTMRKITSDDDNEEDYLSLEDEWGYSTGFQGLDQDGDNYSPVRVFNRTDLPLPQALDWHSGTIFTNCDNAWHTIYARGTNAVLIERKFGDGSVVLATDSYFVSNEAMSKDRHADLLAWLVGANKNVVFDEAHFGIVNTEGVATLMRKYRLQGLAAGLVLLAGLFIWKNSMSLVPPLTDKEQENFIAGKNSADGFVNLLRRSVAPRDLLTACFDEWGKTSVSSAKFASSRVQQAQQIYLAENSPANENRNPVEAYRKISHALGTQKTSSKL